MSHGKLLPFWKWNWVHFENFANICHFAIFFYMWHSRFWALYKCFFTLTPLLLGKNNSSNTPNTASTPTNTVVNTAAGVEDLNIIQVTIPGVYTDWSHIVLCAYILHNTCLVWWSFPTVKPVHWNTNTVNNEHNLAFCFYWDISRIFLVQPLVKKYPRFSLFFFFNGIN